MKKSLDALCKEISESKDLADRTLRMNITVRQSRQSGVARATCPD